MHASSLENMWRCYRRYVAGGPLEQRAETIVLDVGGADVNGTYREVFSNPPFRYRVADIAPGPGIDIVLGDPYRIPLAERSVDIVISGQAMEHIEFFWRTFEEMVRIVRSDGFIFLILPSSGPIHRYPVDCYRFFPDAYDALAKYAGCTRVESWLDERGPWCDLVGVFRRADAPALTAATQPRTPITLLWTVRPAPRRRRPSPAVFPILRSSIACIASSRLRTTSRSEFGTGLASSSPVGRPPVSTRSPRLRGTCRLRPAS
jgi:SAM-dependent methyltransferase